MRKRRYRIAELLGRGGFGSVYKAEKLGEEGFSTIVAVKLLHAMGGFASNPEQVQQRADAVRRLRDEARLLGLLKHRAIVQVFDLEQLRGEWAIVMEYVPGMHLAELGTQASSGTFATIESAVGLLTIVVLFGLWFFRNNRRAVAANMVLIGLGALCLGLATVALKAGWISASVFYLQNGIGLYVAFVPYQSILMDRLLASLRVAATASFLIAVADSFGYLSTVGLYLTRDVATRVMQAELPWSSLLMGASYLVMVLVPATMIGSHLYFRKRMQD